MFAPSFHPPEWLSCRKPLSFAVVILIAALSASAAAEERHRWQGSLDVGVMQLRLQVEAVRDDDGNWGGEIISVDQGNARIPLTRYALTDERLELEAASVGAAFSGDLKDEGRRAEGLWRQGISQFPLTFERVADFVEDTHIETWQGTMEAAGQTFDFQLRIYEGADGQPVGRLDSFTEHVGDLQAQIERTDEELRFTIAISAATFRGRFSDDNRTIEGHWRQSGGEFPLTLRQVDLKETRDLEAPKRPQHPEPPFPYETEEVSFPSRAEGVTLAGTITRPEGDGPFPAAILISGSGPQDRDETIAGHKPFLVIADHLTRHGILVLRFDDRGIGQSTGTFQGSTSEDFAEDVEGAIEYLQQHDRVDRQKIGLIGHSEGGLIAPMVAARRDDVGFLVLLAGTGVTGEEIVLTQSRDITAAQGVAEELLDVQEQVIRSLIEAAQSKEELSDELLQGLIEPFADQLPTEARQSVEFLRAGANQLRDPWFLFFLQYDPRPALRKVTIPVLALNGDRDLQVDAEVNLREIENALREAGNENVKIVKLPGLNHLFQESETGNPAEYGRLEETFSPKALEIISDWIKEKEEKEGERE